MSSRDLYKIVKRLSNGKEDVARKRRSGYDIDSKCMVRTLILMQQWEFLSKVIYDKPDFAANYVEIIDRGHPIYRLPLHEVCRRKPTLELITSLVSAYPMSLLMKDSHDGCTPLHYACRHGASEEVIKYLLKNYPDSAIIEDKYGCSPLVLTRRSSYKHKDDVIKLFDNLYIDEGQDKIETRYLNCASCS